MSEYEQLSALLDTNTVDRSDDRAYPSPPQVASQVERPPSNMNMSQWQVGPDGSYFASGRTVEALPSGNYWPRYDNNRGIFLQCRPILCDEIMELPDSASLKVLAIMRRFWDSRSVYEKHRLLYKRGVLLWGPPGSGKTATVQLLCRDILTADGIVIHYASDVGMTVMSEILKSLRNIEPIRNVIIVLEDIDEIIASQGEHAILSILDGELQLDNVVYIATTNYPEKLGARIVNRPSRFDERILIGMPSAAARYHYLAHSTGSDCDTQQWTDDTEGLSIAHLRELVAAVYCLGQPYADTLDRLKSMMERPKTMEGFAERQIGMVNGNRAHAKKVAQT